MKRVLVALVFLVCPFTALAQVPSSAPLGLPDSTANKYMRVGSPHWGHYHTVRTSQRPVLESPGAHTTVTDVHLFAWGSLINVSCTAQATFCFVQTTTITMGTGTSDGVLTDADTGKPDGPGACFRVEAGIYRDVSLFRYLFQQKNAIAARTGYCSGNATTPGWPCDADADCGNGGTCNTTNDAHPDEKIKGAFLLSIAPVATNCFVSEEF